MALHWPSKPRRSHIVNLGVDAAVAAPSLLPSGTDLGEQLLELAELTDPRVPLAVYELPEPEHRLLSADEVGNIARTGRFVFMKDTCRQIEPFTAKVAAARGTALKVFQTNMTILPPSLANAAALDRFLSEHDWFALEPA